jgi:hypothetical protein
MPIDYNFKSFLELMWLLYIFTISGVSTKAPKKKGKKREQNVRIHIQEDKWNSKRMNHKGNIKFSNPFQEVYQIMKREHLLNESLI